MRKISKPSLLYYVLTDKKISSNLFEVCPLNLVVPQPATNGCVPTNSFLLMASVFETLKDGRQIGVMASEKATVSFSVRMAISLS